MLSFFQRTKTKQCLLYFTLLIFISTSVLFLTKPKLSFREMTDQLFLEDITTDTLSLHYTIAHPSHYSSHSYPLTLPKYNKTNLNFSKIKIENSLSALSDINTSYLSPEESYCHDLLHDYFTLQIKGFPFTDFEECFSPSVILLIDSSNDHANLRT